jgi:1,5-anhydro-D-fructose reductase (1,5-anhydro-D-mannitol-forming)
MVTALRGDTRARLLGVASGEPLRAGQFAAEHGIPRAYRSFDALWADPDVDAVYVSSVNAEHRAHVLAAAACGKHVLCEKPLAVTIADAVEMVGACSARGVVLGVNHQLRCAPVYGAVTEVLRQGAIGQVRAARILYGVGLLGELGLTADQARQAWRVAPARRGGGVALDLTVHSVDLLRYLLDDEVTEVAALPSSLGLGQPGVDDTVAATLRFAQGAVATLLDSFSLPFSGTALELHGSRGSLVVERAMHDDPVAEPFVHDATGRRPIEVGARDEAYTAMIRRFDDAILRGGRPPCTGEDGIRALEVALAALGSPSATLGGVAEAMTSEAGRG